MKAVVTGASSGIGKSMVKYLGSLGYEVIGISKDEDRLIELKKEFSFVTKTITKDLSIEQNLYDIYEDLKNEDIDIFVNNAGFGTVGTFDETSLETEVGMMKVNVMATHILFKLFLKDMVKKNKGAILNVSSISGFCPGPNMATYFATKAYVYRLTQSVWLELKDKKSAVKVSVLCPSPTTTRFDEVANVKYEMKYLTSDFVAKEGIDGLLKGKWVTTPGMTGKGVKIISKILPDKLVGKIIGSYPEKRS